jgi:hypothetical protein
MADNSALYGFVDKIRKGEQVSDETIEEIARVLRLLRDEGWSGFITADKALAGIIEASRADA